MTVKPLVTHIYFQGSVYLESHAAPEHAAYAACSQSSHLPTLPPNHRVRFSGGRQTYVRAAVRLAWVMAINAARNQDSSGKGLAVEGLANSRAVLLKGWATITRMRPSRVCATNSFPIFDFW